MQNLIIESTSVENPKSGKIVNGFVRLTNRINSDKWSIKWSIAELDDIYDLSESLAGQASDMDRILLFLNSQEKKFPNLSGSLRWGSGKGLNFRTAYCMAILLVTWWNMRIRKWASKSMLLQ